MIKYQAHIMAIVQVTTEPLETDDPQTALKFLVDNVDLDKLFRNITGTRQVAESRYTGTIESIVLDELTETGDFRRVVVELDEKDVKALKER